MSLKNRLNKLEQMQAINAETSGLALFFWNLHREDHPEAPESPPIDYVQFYQGKTIEDLIIEAHQFDSKL